MWSNWKAQIGKITTRKQDTTNKVKLIWNIDWDLKKKYIYIYILIFQLRLNKSVTQSQKDKDEIESLEKRLQEEKQIRTSLETQSNQDKKCREEQSKQKLSSLNKYD